MNRFTRLCAAFSTVAVAFTATVGAGALASATALAAPAHAAASNRNMSSRAASSALPADPAAKGYVGLCNEAGQNLTGGSTEARPFAWKAVASTAPPSGYQGRGQNAVLGIFAPRPDTLPAEWGGTSLTAASYYRQEKTPAAQATYDDQSLASVISQYPPQVDGLYVLRMYFGKVNYGDYSITYPTTTIQVTGTSWRVVDGGTVDCSKASAISNEQLTGVAGKKATTPRAPSSTQRTVDTDRSRVITAPGAGTNGTGGSSGSSSPSSLSASPAAQVTHSSSLSWVVWVLAGVVALLAIALGAVMRTRRRDPSPS